MGIVFGGSPLKSLRNIVHHRHSRPPDLIPEGKLPTLFKFTPNNSVQLSRFLPNLQLLKPPRQRHS